MTNRSAATAPGPHLVSATLCETVLKEEGGSTSLIRIVDRLTASGSGPDVPDQMPPIKWQGNLVATFRFGNAQGPVPVKITLTKPSGIEEPKPLVDISMHCESGNRGQNIITQLGLELTEAGPYWFNIYVGGEFVTKTNLEVIWMPMRGSGTPA